MLAIGAVGIAPATVLAPMAGVTDTVFRRFIRNLGGCGLIMTEFTSSHGVSASAGRKKPTRTLKYLAFAPDEHPISAQLFGADPAVMANAARICQDLGFDILDINFGCPVSKVTKCNGGSGCLRDLPLVELRSRPGSRDLAVVISGDGGWASIDKQIGESLAAAGVPVVGLNSLHYFWKARTPEQASADLTRILRHYLSAWHASDVVLVGYSRGADVLPFMTARLPEDLRGRVRLVALVGLSRRAGFEFHFADLFRGENRTDRPTVPEIQRLRGIRLLCVYGADEEDSACRDLPRNLAVEVELPGGHHFGGAYRAVAGRILQMIRPTEE